MRRSGIVTLFLGLLAIGAAELLYAFHTEHIAYDAGHYAGFAAEIARNGLFGYHLSIGSFRTYGYPLFVRVVAAPWLDDWTVVRWAVFHAHLGALLLGAAVAGRVLARVTARPGFGLAVFGAIILNPFLLTRAVSTTSDLLSAVLCFVAVLLALPIPRTPGSAVATCSST
jgi:hypothetical protein